MEQYIPKSVLVSEIERKKEEEVNYDEDSKSFASYADQIHYSVLDSIHDFVNTLEVKEVDLDKEIDEHWNEWQGKYGFHFYDFAKYFLELGLKLNQNG